MSRQRIFVHFSIWLCATLVAGAAFGSDLPPSVAFQTAADSDLGIDFVADPAATAFDHSSRGECDESKRRSASVGLEWSNGPAPATERRVHISKFWDGFTTGQFETSAPIAPEVGAVTVTSPEPGVVYYWRVLTRTDAGWVSSDTARFAVPVCPWDPPNLEALGLTEDSTEGGER